MLTKSLSLKQLKKIKQGQFDGFFKIAKKRHSQHLVLFYAPIIEKSQKFAVISSKKTGNAVKRNRNKRILRELLRLNQSKINKKYDIVLIAKNKMNDSTYNTIQDSFFKLIETL